MTKGAIAAAAGSVVLAVRVVKWKVSDWSWQCSERRAEAYLAATIPPPPPEESEEPCECDLCTRKTTFEEWVEELYCETLGLAPTRRDLQELDVYWAEDWETVS